MEIEKLSPSRAFENEKSGKKQVWSWQYLSLLQTLAVRVEFYSGCGLIWSYFIAAYITFVKLSVLAF